MIRTGEYGGLAERAARMLAALTIALTASACANEGGERSARQIQHRAAPYLTAPRPAIPAYAPLSADTSTAQPNAEIARDFIELTFATEWGERRTGLIRWESPVRVRMNGDALAAYAPFLEEYLAQLRNGGRVDIAMARPDEPAMLKIRFAPGDEMRENLSSALCIVVPGAPDWAEILGKKSRQLAPYNWTLTQHVRGATVFIPNDAAPYQVRLCLMEEVAQALGPGNDLYRLADSIYNDDSAHNAPTPFDLLILRVLYDPHIHAGMGERAALHMAKMILDEVNPAGRRLPPRRGLGDEPTWKRAVLASSTRHLDPGLRLTMTRNALSLAESFPDDDHRKPFSRVRLAALIVDDQPKLAAQMLRRAIEEYHHSVGIGDVRVAIARTFYARALNTLKHYQAAIAQTDLALPILAANRKEAQIAVALSEKSNALAALGALGPAIDLAALSLDWGVYVYGADHEILARRREDIRHLQSLGPDAGRAAQGIEPDIQVPPSRHILHISD